MSRLTPEQRRNVETNRPLLRAAFASLRARGYLAYQNFSCCGSCAAYELTDIAVERRGQGKVVRGCVFYHQQDHEELLRSGRVYLGFGPLHNYAEDQPVEVIGDEASAIGEEVVQALRSRGLSAEWNGSENQRILVDLTQSQKQS